MYKSVLKPIFFSLDPEKAHHLTFNSLRFINKIPGVSALIRAMFQVNDPRLETNVFGLTFKNPVGLAAGLDKDASLYSELENFGFGFIEIGTLTPKGQPGNPKKRLFRLIEDQGLINRMGFNNQGVLQAVERLKKNKGTLIGGNIGKNKSTENKDAMLDYAYCFDALYDYVDYFVVNVSSPNTPNLRALQDKEPLTALLQGLMDLNKTKVKQKPILLKIAPDLSDDQLIDIIEIVAQTKIDGVIATNTTLSREGLISQHKQEAGGLSGAPVAQRSTEVIRFLAQKSNKAFPIIGVGGINSAQDALDKIEAGADLIQVFSGFIYQGPALVKQINEAIIKQRSN